MSEMYITPVGIELSLVIELISGQAGKDWARKVLSGWTAIQTIEIRTSSDLVRIDRANSMRRAMAIDHTQSCTVGAAWSCRQLEHPLAMWGPWSCS